MQQTLVLSPISFQNHEFKGIPLNLDNIIYAFEGKGNFDTLNYSDIFIQTANQIKKNLHYSTNYSDFQNEKTSVKNKLNSIKQNYNNPKYDNDAGIEKLRKYIENLQNNEDLINKCAEKQLHAKQITKKLEQDPKLKSEFITKYQENINKELEKFPHHTIVIPGSDPNIEFSGLDITNAKYWAVKGMLSQNTSNPKIAICGGLQAMLHNAYSTTFATLGNVNASETKNGAKKGSEIEEFNQSRNTHGHCPQTGMYHNPSDSPVKNTSAERCEHNQVVLAKKKPVELDENDRLKTGITMLPAFAEEHKKHGAIFTNDGIISDISKTNKFIVHYAFQVDASGKLQTIGIQHHIDVEHEKGPKAIEEFTKIANTYNKEKLTEQDCEYFGIPENFVGKKMTFNHVTNAIQNVNYYLNAPEKRDVGTQFSLSSQGFESGNIKEPNISYQKQTHSYLQPLKQDAETQKPSYADVVKGIKPYSPSQVESKRNGV